MTVFSYETELPLIKFSSNSEERNIHSYNESSAVYVIDEDFGSITASVDTDEDYGSITDTDISGWNAVDYGLITINQTLVPYGPINIGDNDIAAVKLVKVGIGDVTFTILGEAFIFTTPIEKGSGFIRINGTSGDPRFTLAHVGTGSLFALSSSTEVKGSNPPEDTALFRISGSALESIADIHVGSGSLFTFVSKTEIFSSTEQAQGLFRVSGSSVVIASLSHFGSGRIFAFTGSSEATTVDPPDSTLLATFAGTAEYQFFRNNTASTEGSLTLRGESTDTFASAYAADVLIAIDGSATESITPAPHIGTGTLFAFTGSSESLSANPPEDTALFRVAGTAIESSSSINIGSVKIDVEGAATTIFELGHIGSVKIDVEGAAAESITPAPHIGTGKLFAFSGSSESLTVNPLEDTALFRVTGVANYKLTSTYSGKVKIDVEGTATTIFGLGHIGSGSLFGFSSTTEVISVNPPEETVLFKFTGSVAEKKSRVYIGSGSLFGFSSATESSSSVEKSGGLFKFSGRARDIFVLNNIGSGSLFGFSSATESISVNPPEETVLFKFTGSVVEKKSRVYVGSGSLFGFSSATESSSNVGQSEGLFRISGSSTESFVPAPHIGTGRLLAFSSATETRAVSPQASGVFTFAGSVVEKKSRAYVGSGSLFGFSSATESFAITPSTFAPLFKISGVVRESFVPAPHIGSGALRAFSSATETRAVFPKSNVLFEFHGNTVEKSTRSQLGSGSLFGITGSYEATEVIPKIAGVLFTLFGFARESITPATEIASGITVLRGASTDRKVVFVPAKPTRIIII